MDTNKKLRMIETTKELLLDCHKAGYHMLTIGRPDPEKNPCCKTWPDGPESLWAWHPTFIGYNNGSRNTEQCCKQHGNPTIWDIPKKYGIKGGCSNGHQSQLLSNYKDIIVSGTFPTTSVRAINKAINDYRTQLFMDSI